MFWWRIEKYHKVLNALSLFSQKRPEPDETNLYNKVRAPPPIDTLTINGW